MNTISDKLMDVLYDTLSKGPYYAEEPLPQDVVDLLKAEGMNILYAEGDERIIMDGATQCKFMLYEGGMIYSNIGRTINCIYKRSSGWEFTSLIPRVDFEILLDRPDAEAIKLKEIACRPILFGAVEGEEWTTDYLDIFATQRLLNHEKETTR